MSHANNVARIAVQAGAAGIIVSNHGARQLDYVPAAIMVLEEVLCSNYFLQNFPVNLRRIKSHFEGLI